MKNKYLNPWFESTLRYGPVHYENDAPLYREHRGVKVYKLNKSHFDCVLDGMCITQLAGFSTTDNLNDLLDGIRPCHATVAEHLRKRGFLANTYHEV